MPAEKIADKMVRGLEPPAKGNRVVWDSEITGFGVRVTAAGAKAFVLRYVTPGSGERRVTIGQYPTWSVTAAREEAKDLRRRIDRGDDPLADRDKVRTDPTVDDLADRYETDHLPRKRASSQRHDRSNIAVIRKHLGKAKVAAIRFGDVEKLHREISRTAPIQANRVAALLSKMMALAIRWEWRDSNPCKGLERNPESKRTRYLCGAELVRLSAALQSHPERASASAVRLLLLTGARKGEVLAARLDDFDLEAGVWIKPGASTKQRTEHRVPLSAPALQLISEIRASAKPGQEFLFETTPGRHLTEIKKFWQSVCALADIRDCRLHDLRHTYASVLASAGLSLPIIGALLGHTQPGTTARYAHLYDDPLRAATERVGAVLSGDAADTQNVVPLRGNNTK